MAKDKIKESIILLRQNGYYVRKIPKNIGEVAKECCETGKGDCLECECCVCLMNMDA